MPIINLLPTDLAPKGPTLKIINYLKQVIFVGFVVFLLISLGLGGFLILTSLELQNSLSRQENLKNQIKNLEQTEQKMVLLRDRVEKINKILSMPNIQSDISNTQKIVDFNSSNINIRELEFSIDKVKLSVTASSSASFKELVDSLTQTNYYKTIILSSLNFNPNVGYSASFELSKK